MNVHVYMLYNTCISVVPTYAQKLPTQPTHKCNCRCIKYTTYNGLLQFSLLRNIFK